MKILYGTSNPAKLASMQRRLAASGLGLEIIGLQDLDQKIPVAPEDGRTPLENARQKALCYYHAFHMPVFSCDSGLYIDELPEELQPGIHVRTVQGKYLSDDEMIAYYGGLAEQYGNLTARYQNAICLILPRHVQETDEIRADLGKSEADYDIYEDMVEGMESEPFWITSKPHQIRKKGFPLDSLSLRIPTGEYYYDIKETQAEKKLDELAVRDAFLEFFQKIDWNRKS